MDDAFNTKVEALRTVAESLGRGEYPAEKYRMLEVVCDALNIRLTAMANPTGIGVEVDGEWLGTRQFIR